LDKPLQQLKSKRKQDRPQRKQIHLQSQDQGQQLNGVFDRLLFKEKDSDDLSKISNEFCDPGYLSDEYSEPISSTKDLLTYSDLENLYQRLDQLTTEPSNHIIINENDKIFSEQLITYLYNNTEHYDKLDKYRLEYYNDENNQRIRLISNILQRIFSICYNQNLPNLFQYIPDEIQTHIKLCLNNVLDENLTKKKILTRGKRLVHFGEKHRNIKIKRSSISNMTNINENLLSNEQQLLLSPSSPLTPVSSKIIEELLSPNNNLIHSGVMEEIPVLPKERDVYEVIHCLCNCEIDNGFMIQVGEILF